MFICICHGISDREIRKLVKSGVDSVQGIQKACKAGGNCGMCICQVKEIVEEDSDTSTTRHARAAND